MADALFGFAFRQLRDRGAAEDAVQQAFLELVKASPDLSGDGRALRAWLFSSVRFECLDEHRRRARRPESPTGDLPETAILDDPAEGMDPRVERALDTLTEQQRAIVHLRHVEGLSGEEVAAALGISRAAAYAAGARAESRLRKALSDPSNLGAGERLPG